MFIFGGEKSRRDEEMKRHHEEAKRRHEEMHAPDTHRNKEIENICLDEARHATTN